MVAAGMSVAWMYAASLVEWAAKSDRTAAEEHRACYGASFGTLRPAGAANSRSDDAQNCDSRPVKLTNDTIFTGFVAVAAKARP